MVLHSLLNGVSV
ncbi:High-affinity branched-chain amino acid transport system permease protein LivH, partial [Candidatus Burkholderia humilis]